MEIQQKKIDEELQHGKVTKKKWRYTLKVIMMDAVLYSQLFYAKNNLALRGEVEKTGH